MRNRALLSALAVCFAVAACESKRDEPPKPKTAQAVVPLPPEAPKAAAASANQDAGPVQAAQATPATPPAGHKGCGHGRCNVKITVGDSVTPCKVTYSTDDLYVFGPNKIKWTATGGWLFDKDGIDLPNGGAQFSNPAGEGTANYSWDDANTDKLKYKYKVNLKKGTKTCKADPSVVNGADSEDPTYPPG